MEKLCRKSKNVRKQNLEGSQTEIKLPFVPSTPLNEDLNGPACCHLVLHPHLILIALWIESQLTDRFYLNTKEQAHLI